MAEKAAGHEEREKRQGRGVSESETRKGKEKAKKGGEGGVKAGTGRREGGVSQKIVAMARENLFYVRKQGQAQQTPSHTHKQLLVAKKRKKTNNLLCPFTQLIISISFYPNY